MSDPKSGNGHAHRLPAAQGNAMLLTLSNSPDQSSTAGSAAIERRIREIGHALFAGAQNKRPLPMTRAWLDDQAMSWTMRDETLKVQLFRFVDSLPGLRTNAQLNRHLHEYLAPIRERIPFGLRQLILQQHGPLAALVAYAARLGSRQLARKFIAASTIPEALTAVKKLRRRGLEFTIDVLGEAVVSDQESDHYLGTYVRLIKAITSDAKTWGHTSHHDHQIAEDLPLVNFSVKLSALTNCFDPSDPTGTTRSVCARLRPLLRQARACGAFVNIDMEQFAFKDLTLQIFRTVLEEEEFRSWPHVGIAIQAYLHSCGEDLQQLARWAESRGTPVWVRLVKGAYHEYEGVIAAQNGWPVPVFLNKCATDANYEAQTRFLLEHSTVLKPAFASHNVRSIAHALAHAESLNIPAHRFEFQMLYGMADPLKVALTGLGQRVRIYTPFGNLLPGMAYLVRRLLENTSNQSFIRAGFLEHAPEEELLMDPKQRTQAEAKPSVTEHFVNEPLTDLSRADARSERDHALADVSVRLGGALIPLVIDGKSVITGQEIISRNPSRHTQVVGRVACAQVSHAELAIAAAKFRFAAWSSTPVPERAAILMRAAEIMRRRRSELSAGMVYEAGKSWAEADADVAEAIDFCRFYAHDMVRLDSPRTRDIPGEENRTFYVSRGVVVVISPWNFPLAILCGMTAAALVAGNTVIMKPAEQTPVIAAKLMEVFSEAGIPPGVLNYLPGIGEIIGPFLVGHPDVSVIAFTGSLSVGLAINRRAAEVAGTPGVNEVKRVICEMGGKNAIIIDDDADLDEAVLGVMHSAFGFQGQKCSACSRAIVLESVYDAFVSRLVSATKSLAMGPAELPGVLGPVIDGEAQQRILSAIEAGKRDGKLVYAGNPGTCSADGYFVGPHIFTDVAADANLAQDEIFGPVLAVIRAQNLDEALRFANGTRYALTGGLYSRSPTHITRVQRELQVGNCYINRKITGALVDRQPFGGYRLSGIGSKAGGSDYLLQFLTPRCVTENTLRHGFSPEVVTS